MLFIVLDRKKIYKISLVFLCLLALLFIIINYYLHTKNKAVESYVNHVYDSSEKIAYLTFDDGPTSHITPQILDILDKSEVKATFFVIGKRVEENPEVLRRIYNEGHLIANHTYSHNNESIYQSKESFLNEIRKTDKIIGDILGIPNYNCRIFRFPNGSQAKAYYNEKQQAIEYLKEIDYTYIDWNSLNDDSMQKYTNDQLVENLKNSVEGKNPLVILMHDSGDVNDTYDALEDSLLYLMEEGYQFKTLENIIKTI